MNVELVWFSLGVIVSNLVWTTIFLVDAYRVKKRSRG